MRIAGVNLPSSKRVVIALQSIYGVGPARARNICETLDIKDVTRVSDLEESMALSIRKVLDQYATEGDLRREVSTCIKRLIDLRCYRGIRHQKRLPVRGQRTRSNARTRKGRATPIAGKKKA